MDIACEQPAAGQSQHSAVQPGIGGEASLLRSTIAGQLPAYIAISDSHAFSQDVARTTAD